jgi:uncharacterized protein (TIGR03083 family)
VPITRVNTTWWILSRQRSIFPGVVLPGGREGKRTEGTPVDTWALLAAERRTLAADLALLRPEQWDAPSQCDRWTVRDVAAHVAMTPRLRPAAVLPAMIRHRFNLERVIGALARNDRRSPVDLVQALREVADARGTPPGASVDNVLADIVLHGQDIRRPLGLACNSSQAALLAAADTLTRSDFNCGSARRARGLRLVADDVDWSFGAGEQVRGPLHTILEAIGGRRASIADLTGPGVEILSSRCAAVSVAAAPRA